MKNTEAYKIIFQACDAVNCDGPTRRKINEALETILETISKTLESDDNNNKGSEE